MSELPLSLPQWRCPSESDPRRSEPLCIRYKERFSEKGILKQEFKINVHCTLFILLQLQEEDIKNKTYHVGLVPHILLTVGNSATQRGRLHILTPVGGATNALFSAEQRCG